MTALLITLPNSLLIVSFAPFFATSPLPQAKLLQNCMLKLFNTFPRKKPLNKLTYSSYVWLSSNSLNVDPFQCNIPPAKPTDGKPHKQWDYKEVSTDVLDRSTILQKDNFWFWTKGTNEKVGEKSSLGTVLRKREWEKYNCFERKSIHCQML